MILHCPRWLWSGNDWWWMLICGDGIDFFLFLFLNCYCTWYWEQGIRRRANPVVDGYRQAGANGCPCFASLVLCVVPCFVASLALFVSSVLFVWAMFICNLVWINWLYQCWAPLGQHDIFIFPSVSEEGDPSVPGWILYCLCSYWIISHDQSKGLNSRMTELCKMCALPR